MSDSRLDEILAWIRIMGSASLRSLLETHIRSQTDWVVFQETNGDRNREAVGTIAGISGRAVGNKWSAWREAGIVIDDPQYDHPRHIASAVSVGFEKPAEK